MSELETVNSADDASDAEVNRYEKSYAATRTVLDEAIETLEIQEALEEDSDVRAQISTDRMNLETERDDLVRAHTAFHTSNAVMFPPSAAQVAEIVALAKQASALTAEKATAAAILKLTTSALNKFAEIQKIGSGA
jgi:hypothetical protein